MNDSKPLRFIVFFQETNGEKEGIALREPEPVCSCERDPETPVEPASPVSEDQPSVPEVVEPVMSVASPARSIPLSPADQESVTSVNNEEDRLTTEEEEPSAEEDTVVVKDEETFDDALTGVTITELCEEESRVISVEEVTDESYEDILDEVVKSTDASPDKSKVHTPVEAMGNTTEETKENIPEEFVEVLPEEDRTSYPDKGKENDPKKVRGSSPEGEKENSGEKGEDGSDEISGDTPKRASPEEDEKAISEIKEESPFKYKKGKLNEDGDSNDNDETVEFEASEGVTEVSESIKGFSESTVLSADESLLPVVNVLENDVSEPVDDRTLSVDIENSDVVVQSDVSKLVEREVFDSDTSEAYLTPTERESDPVEIPQSVSDNLPNSVHLTDALEDDQDHEESGSDKVELPVNSETCSNETEPSCDITNVSLVSEHSEQDKDPSIDQSIAVPSEDKVTFETDKEEMKEEEESTLSPEKSLPMAIPGSPQRIENCEPVDPKTENEYDTIESPGKKTLK